MIIHSVEQRTEAWHQLRIGRITGTKIKDMAAGKPATVELLCKKMAAEKITGVSTEKPFKVTDAMQHGIDTEDEARAEYQLNQLVRVQEVGFISKGDLFGFSPDGLVDHDGGVEIKCPAPQTHLGYLLSNGSAWRSYKWQCQGFLWITQRAWIDFVSYCPSFPESKRLLIERVRPDDEMQVVIHNAAIKMEARVSEILEAIK